MARRLLVLLGVFAASAASRGCHKDPMDDAQAASPRAVVAYHVAAGPCSHGTTECSDANSGRSRQEPLCTVQAGLDRLAAGSGEVLAIHTGVYVDDAELPSWADSGGESPSTPLTIQGADGDDKAGIVLRGTAAQSPNREDPAARDTATLRIAGPSSERRIRNIRVRNLTINPGNVHGIFVMYASRVEVDGVDFGGWQGRPIGGNKAAAFAVKGSDHVTLKNSSMTNGGVQQPGASGIEIGTSSSDVLVYRNVVHDFEGGCTHGSSNGSGKGRALFALNDFRNCKGDTDESATFQVYNDQDFMFYGNVVEVPENGRNEVFSIRRTDENAKTASAHIIGNTIVSRASRAIFGVRVWGRTPDAAVIRNNVFIGFDRDRGSNVIRVEHLSPCDGYDEDYNLVLGLPPAPLLNDSGCPNVAWGSHTVLSAAAPLLSPLYVPLPGSPVIDAGDPLLGYPEGTSPPKDVGALDLGGDGELPSQFAPTEATAQGKPTFRWRGTASVGEIVLYARSRPPTSQSAFRVQVDTVPSFDSAGVATPLLDSGLVRSSEAFWVATESLPPGRYYARVTLSDVGFEQEWSDPFFRFTITP